MTSKNNETVIFHNENFLDECIPVMMELREMDKFCDVKLKIGNQIINAHRLVLASSIPYFYTMFLSEMSECRSHDIEMNEVEPEAFKDIINYAYTGKIMINQQNATHLLVGASYLQINQVLKACSEFLKLNLQCQNVLSVRRLADSLDCNDLKEHCTEYISKNFSKISRTSEFLCMDFDELMEFIRKDDLQVESEEVVYEACMKWIKFDEIDRKPAYPKLFNQIRLVYLTHKYLDEHVICNYYLEYSTECNKSLAEARDYCNEPKLQGQRQTFRTKPRCYLGYLYVLCGYENKAGWPVNSLEYFDPAEEKWHLGEKVNINRKYFGVAGLENKLYAIGGEVIQVHVSCGYGSESLEIVEVFDPLKKQWSKAPEMQLSRKSPGVVAYNNCLYVCGGTSGTAAVNKVEFYSPELEAWQSVCPMGQVRRRCCAVALYGYIYVLGGFGFMESLNAVERYDPELDFWEPVSAMLEPRSDFGATIFDGKIYVCGGFNGRRQLNTLEVFNPETNEWTQLASMSEEKSGVALTAYMGKLWAIGGYDGNRELSTVEIYDPERNCWTAGTPTNRPKAFGGATVFAQNIFKKS